MYGFIGNIGPWELVFILLVALIVVGPGKLPEVARSLGKAANEFRRITTGVKREFEDAMRFDEPTKKASNPAPVINVSPVNTSNAQDTGNKTEANNNNGETETKTTEEEPQTTEENNQ